MAAILELRQVRKAYDAFTVVDNFDFQVNQGELRCLLGPNGAGKTTTIDLITGRQRITSGKIIFEGHDITGLREHEIVRRGIGRKFQVPAVFKELSVRENFNVALSEQTGPFQNMLRFKASHRGDRLDRMIDLVGLRDRLDELGGNLSHGETQWLELGMVLIQNPRLLLLDEPAAGMTEAEKHKTSQIFNSLKGEHTLVVVEHDMAFVREIADIVTVMHMGKLLAQGPMHEVEKDSRVREVYLGTDGGDDAP